MERKRPAHDARRRGATAQASTPPPPCAMTNLRRLTFEVKVKCRKSAPRPSVIEDVKNCFSSSTFLGAVFNFSF